MLIISIIFVKKVVFFCKNEVRFSKDGGVTPIAFPSAEADEEGFTAIRNKNQLR